MSDKKITIVVSCMDEHHEELAHQAARNVAMIPGVALVRSRMEDAHE